MLFTVYYFINFFNKSLRTRCSNISLEILVSEMGAIVLNNFLYRGETLTAVKLFGTL